MYTVSLLLVGVALVTGLPQDVQLVRSDNRLGKEFICPEDSGVYEDELQCDKYWVCEAGVAKAQLCDDGLVFDIFKADAGHVDPCESPYVVDCGLRLELQPATFTSEFCPRKNGIFADPDPSVCSRFYTCIKGHATATDCTSGLHFDESTGNCAWPATANRVNCSETARACVGDFCCTGSPVVTADGVTLPHPTYANVDDCQKFWVCLNGATPQESSCGLGQVYNERTMMCDYPEYVDECKDWYVGNPLFDAVYEDTNNDGRVDFGNRRDFSQTSIN
ncbi:protein obstructor-E-like isoform X1 [Macrobrachium nipponense]|uniref:protein obstructor-E-like isoform X1 n=1 Tax=Macrobrachium nipponense TaxID=159736 RepID=UPI0030C8BD3C